MNDSEFPWDNYAGEFETVTTAMFVDPALVEATAQSQLLATKLTYMARNKEFTQGPGGDSEAAMKELDGMVRHLMGDPAVVNGLVQAYDPELGDEGEFVQVDDQPLVFNGFVISSRNGKIEFDYQFKGWLNEKGELLDARQYSSSAHGYVTFQARPNQVQLDMDIKHPLQANAWLEAVAPLVLTELDAVLIPVNKAYGPDQLCQLGEFSVSPSLYVDTPRAEEQFLNAVKIYTESFIKPDHLLPYRLDINGPILLSGRIDQPRIYEPKEVALKNRLFNMEQPYLTDDTQQGETTKRYVFAANGILHSTKDEPGEIIAVKLKRLSNIRSIR